MDEVFTDKQQSPLFRTFKSRSLQCALLIPSKSECVSTVQQQYIPLRAKKALVPTESVKRWFSLQKDTTFVTIYRKLVHNLALFLLYHVFSINCTDNTAFALGFTCAGGG